MKNEEKIEKKKRTQPAWDLKNIVPAASSSVTSFYVFKACDGTHARVAERALSIVSLWRPECISQSVYPSSESYLSFSCAAYQWGGRIAANSFACVVVVVGVRNTILHGYGRRRVRRIDAQNRHDR